MAHKNLQELLKEEQEPFYLKDYIALRKSQLKISQKTPQFFKKCTNTPLIEFPLQVPATSPSKSPISVPVRLHVPARTAALLFEAAIKIQTQKKPRNQIKNIGFTLFGSILKKLSARSWAGNREIGNVVGGSEISRSGKGRFAISCSYESSSGDRNKTTRTEFDESVNFGAISPFGFAPRNCPSPARQTRVLSSPAISPSRRRIQENVNRSSDEEEEKEQFSPVSVLDPPFVDDDDASHDDGDDTDDYKIECSNKFVQRVQQQLLHKLRRFDKLAKLDPIELEKRMLEEENKEVEDHHEEAIHSTFSEKQNGVQIFVDNVLGQSGGITGDIKKLVLDLINEENKEGSDWEVAKMVRQRLDSWKEVQPNTIDMMVEFDFRRETEEWKGSDKGDTSKIASEVEAAMFGCLVEELSEELFSLPMAF